MTPEDIIKEVEEKWSEYLEMAEDCSAMTCNILAHQLLKERQNTDYLKKRLKNYEKLYDFKN